MDPAYHALLLQQPAALTDLDGAIVELQVHPAADPDDTPIVTAEVRIPGPAVP